MKSNEDWYVLRSYERNFSNCVEKPEKFRASTVLTCNLAQSNHSNHFSICFLTLNGKSVPMSMQRELPFSGDVVVAAVLVVTPWRTVALGWQTTSLGTNLKDLLFYSYPLTTLSLVIFSTPVNPSRSGRKWHYAGANKQYSLKKSCYSLIIINIRGQIENRPLQNTRSAGRKWLTAGC